MREHRVERNQGHAVFDREVRGHVGIVRHHVHAEGGGGAGYQASHVADADDAEGLAEELRAAEPGSLPVPRLDRRVGRSDVARDGEQQPDGQLGRGLSVGTGRIHYQHAPLGGRPHVDVVHPGTGSAYHPQLGTGFDHRPAHLGLRAHQQAGAGGHGAAQLVGGEVVAFHYFDCRVAAQLLHALRGNWLGHQHALHAPCKYRDWRV